MEIQEIKIGLTYLSIHDVPYRVLDIDNGVILAEPATGRYEKPFHIRIERFAEAMNHVK